MINITLIYRKLNDELTASEEDRLQKWLEASAEHRRYFERMRRYLEQAPECVVSEDEIDEAWKALAGKVASRQRRSWRIWGVYGTGVAAMIVLCLGGWMLWKGMSEPDKGEVREIVRNEIVPGKHMAILELANGESHRLGVAGLQEKQIGTHIMVDSCRLSYVRPDSQSLQIAYNKLSVPRGGEYQLKLEDGTKVWLNSDSRLKYPEVFVGNLREVFLEGEAYFEVAADSLKPFVVNANRVAVTVLGTRFNVATYAEKRGVETTLVEGNVRVCNGEKKVVLIPGEQALADHQGGIVKRRVDTHMFVSWVEGIFEFEAMPLLEIMERLARWYDIEFRFDSEELYERCFTGVFERDENLNDILKVIEKTTNVRFDMQGTEVVVKSV